MAQQPMTKAEIVAALAQASELTQAQAQALLEALIALCRQEVAAGKSFRLAGLGTFSLKASAARQGRNPSTGAAIQIPAKKRMAFKAGAQVDGLLNPGE